MLKQEKSKRKKPELKIETVAVHPQRRTFFKVDELRTAARILAKHGFYAEPVQQFVKERKRVARAFETKYTLSRRIGERIVAVTVKVENRAELKASERRLLLVRLRERVRFARTERRETYEPSKIVALRDGTRLTLEKRGGVFVKSNAILELAAQIARKRVYTEKRPLENVPHVGIEVECYIPRLTNEGSAELTEERVANTIVAFGLSKNVCLGHDGSIEAERGHVGFELRILAKQAEYARIVNTVCKMLRALGAKVNKSCGLHVHLDVRQRVKETVFHNLVVSQPLLFALVPESRRNNRYCKANTIASLRDQLGCGERYLAVNPEAVNRHSTIEVRLHSPSTDARKIVNWISLLIRIADAPRMARGLVGNLTVSDLGAFGIKVTKRHAKYLEDRCRRFAGHGASEDLENVA